MMTRGCGTRRRHRLVIAMWELGNMYEKGLGVRRDQQKAQQWRAKGNVTEAPKTYGFITHDFGP
jgi:hypothetical protein